MLPSRDLLFSMGATAGSISSDTRKPRAIPEQSTGARNEIKHPPTCTQLEQMGKWRKSALRALWNTDWFFVLPFWKALSKRSPWI